MQRHFKHLNWRPCLSIHKASCKAAAGSWVLLWAALVVPPKWHLLTLQSLLRVSADKSPVFPHPLCCCATGGHEGSGPRMNETQASPWCGHFWEGFLDGWTPWRCISVCSESLAISDCYLMIGFAFLVLVWFDLFQFFFPLDNAVSSGLFFSSCLFYLSFIWQILTCFPVTYLISFS